ncbi:MAG: tail fiber domain-containing protein, partial [Dinghuibacter sp.]|nr:tail fiber domain-containing protein [Dinghuibacter sp.]
TEGRLQITGFSNGDQLSLRHPSSVNLKWGLYVSSIDSSLNFYSNGSLRANIDRVTGVYTALSDRSKKKNIQPMGPVLETLMRLPAYSYNYFDSKDDDRRMLGFMAQDVRPYFPELVYQRYDREVTQPVLTMDYSGLGVIAIKAIQEQQNIILQQQQKLDKQQLQIELLTRRIEQLEQR